METEGTVRLKVLEALSLKHRVEKCTHSTDGKRIAVCLGDFSVRIYDEATSDSAHAEDEQESRPSLRLFCTFKGHTLNVWSAGFSADSRLLCSGSSDMTVRVWHLEKQESVFTFTQHSDTVWCCSFMPCSSDLVASGSSDKTVKIWNHVTGELLHNLNTYNGVVESLSFSKDGTKLCTGSRDCRVILWTNVSPKTNVTPDNLVLYEGEEWIRFVAFSKHDQNLLLTSGSSNTVLMWDLSEVSLTEQQTPVTSKTPSQTASRKTLKTVRFSDEVESGQRLKKVHSPILELKGHLNTVWDACFAAASSDLDLVITCSGDRSLRYTETIVFSLKSCVHAGFGILGVMVGAFRRLSWRELQTHSFLLVPFPQSQNFLLWGRM